MAEQAHGASCKEITSIATRKTYTLEFKLNVLKWLKEHNKSMRATAREFGVHRRMIQRWLASESQLQSTLLAEGSQRRKLSTPRSTSITDGSRRESLSLNDDNIHTSCGLSPIDNLGLNNIRAKSQKKRVNGANRCRSLLSSTSKNKSIRLAFVPSSVVPSSQPLLSPSSVSSSGCFGDVHFEDVYMDYTTPEHNYCQKADSPVWFGDSLWSRDVLILPSDHVMHNHEITIGGSKQNETVTDNNLKIIIETPHELDLDDSPLAQPLHSNDCDGVTDGTLVVGSRLSEPVFLHSPEIVYLSHHH
jgi:transposase-like protein